MQGGRDSSGRYVRTWASGLLGSTRHTLSSISSESSQPMGCILRFAHQKTGTNQTVPNILVDSTARLIRIVGTLGGGMARQPMYQQIADDLRRQIETGDLAQGSQLPTELELGGTYKASRN